VAIGRHLPDEFALIARYFAPLARDPGAFGLADDVALMQPTPGHVHVLKVDTIVEGVHYLAGDPPDLVAKKLLRVNLSDLAAKGARPKGYLLALSLARDTTPEWLEGFARGLAEDQDAFGISLFGGDTTSTPGPTNLSLTAIGEAEAGRVPHRSGATAGEDVYVSGTLGDAALGLRAIRGELPALDESDRKYLAGRYRLPEPRIALGQAVAAIVSASIDISDGLAADLGHICDTSGVGAEVEFAALPLSPPARAALSLDPSLASDIVAAGDDYEILFTAPPERAAAVAAAARTASVAVTRIGRIVAGTGVAIRDATGRALSLAHPGYRHF